MIYVVLEWLQLISLAFCIGVISCRLWFFTRSMQTEFSYQGNSISVMWKLFCFGLALLIGCAFLGLIARSVEMSGRPVSGIFPVLPLVLFKTHYGTVWLVRIGALLLLAVAKTAARYRDTRPFLVTMLVLALAVAVTSSASGHGADAGDFSGPEIMDWLHLVAACLWGGGLLVLTFAVFPDLIGRGTGSAPLISRVASRFSAMAGVAVALVAVTAVYNFLIDVQSVQAMAATPYGLAVAAKILLFLGVINFGAFNRYVSVPRLQQWGGVSPKDQGIFGHMAETVFAPFSRNLGGRRMAARFRVLVGIEAFVIVGVLFCASVLRHEIPARHFMHMQHMHKQGAPAMPPGGMHMHHE